MSRRITEKIFIILTALSLAAVSNAAGSKNSGIASSADILSPFGCDADPAVDCESIGTATLYRSAAGVGVFATIAPGSLPPNYPLTFWIVAFNNANQCAAFPQGACGAGDLGNPAVNASIQWAGGNYSDLDGGAILQAFVPNSATDRLTLSGDGITNGQLAEIHFIYRTHTPTAGEEWAAINTPGGSPPTDDFASSVHLRSN